MSCRDALLYLRRMNLADYEMLEDGSSTAFELAKVCENSLLFVMRDTSENMRLYGSRSTCESVCD